MDLTFQGGQAWARQQLQRGADRGALARYCHQKACEYKARREEGRLSPDPRFAFWAGAHLACFPLPSGEATP